MKLDFLKALVIGALQEYIYEQTQDLIDWLKKNCPVYFDEEGNLRVAPEDMLQFMKSLLKGLCYVIRHGGSGK